MSRGRQWGRTLTPEQRKTVNALRDLYSSRRNHRSKGGEGWTVYMMPSTQPATYLELRHRLMDGHVARWVIERDGTVSAHNSLGTLRRMGPA